MAAGKHDSPPDTEKFPRLTEKFLRLGLRLRLKENFDRFNFANYKEKEMADFRRIFTALALVALFVGLASAQGGLQNPGSMSCSTTTTVTPIVRSEGFTEQVGDIVLNCTGGTLLASGSLIPTANITVFLNTQVTSRVFSTTGGNVSEALLLIDEPGSTSAVGYGAQLPQMVCTTPLSGCAEYVGNTTGPPAGVNVPVTTSGGTTAAPNVFQGVVSGNSVTFYGVPVLPPTTTGSRIFRITNIRANAAGLGGGGATPTAITGSVSISPANAFTINQPLNTLAFIQQGLNTTASGLRTASNGGNTTTATSFQQCVSSPSGSITGQTAGIQFVPGFPTAFKTRVAVFPAPGNTNPTAAVNSQNIPGQIYNSESGFTLNVNPAGAGAASTSATAGLADWGTRLKAVFSNIPSGVSVYVTATNYQPGTTTPAVATTAPYAVAVISETVPDTGTTAPQATTTSSPAGTVLVPVSAGTGSVTWEVLNANYTTVQNYQFGVFVVYTANPGANVPAPGPMSVSLSLAPNPTQGAFSAANAADPTKVNIIPRFADTSTAKTFAQVGLCNTVLLFPFVTSNNGFETGLAISNTSQDPFGTTPQSGTCALNWYQAGASGTNPAVGTTPSVAGGTTLAFLASNATYGVGTGSAFTGYMFAVCNFQLAHGYAAITDIGARGVLSSYLALVVGTPTTSSRSGNASEMLMH